MSAGLIKAARRFSTTIGAGGVDDASVTTIPMTLIPPVFQDGDFIEIVIDRVSITGELTPDSEEVIVGQVSGTNIVNAERGVEGTAQSHSAGAVVEIKLQADMWNRMIDAMLLEHDQSGSHDPAVVTLNDEAQTLTGKTLTEPVLNKPKTKQKYEEWEDNSDGETITLNLSNGNLHRVTLGGNRTIAFSNPVSGQTFILRVTQDGSGGRGITWPSGISWQEGSAPDQPKTADTVDVYGFICTNDDKENEFANPTFDGFLIANEMATP